MSIASDDHLRTRRIILLSGLLISFAINSLMVLLGYYRYSYDAYTHMFFADHYRRNWFNLWEDRWYGGFSIATYPPLSHQLIALPSFIVGVENSYKIVLVLTALLITYGSYEFTKIFAEDSAPFAALVASVFPSIGLLLNAYGQLPTVLASALALIALSSYHSYLGCGGYINLLATTTLFAATALCHHLVIFFFAAPLAILVFSLEFARNPRRAFKRTLIVATLTLPLIFIPLLPYYHSMKILMGQASIPHGSRENIFGNFILSLMFFWGIYSFTIALLPNVVAIALRRKKMLPLAILLVVYLLFGLGGTTPIPKLILGSLWEILTYDKFSFWASLIYIPFLAIMLKYAGIFIETFYMGENNPSPKPRTKKILISIFMFFLTLSYVLASGTIVSLKLQPIENISDEVLLEIAKFLDQYTDFYYITLGLANQRVKLSMLTSAPTLDGGYNSARMNPLLANSGVENIDAAKYFPNGINLVKSILAEAPTLGLKYVVCADSFYDPLLIDYGFRVAKVYKSRTSVKIWVLELVDNARKLDKPQTPLVYSLLWGLFPPIILLLAFSALILRVLSSRRRES